MTSTSYNGQVLLPIGNTWVTILTVTTIKPPTKNVFEEVQFEHKIRSMRVIKNYHDIYLLDCVKSGNKLYMAIKAYEEIKYVDFMSFDPSGAEEE